MVLKFIKKEIKNLNNPTEKIYLKLEKGEDGYFYLPLGYYDIPEGYTYRDGKISDFPNLDPNNILNSIYVISQSENLHNGGSKKKTIDNFKKSDLVKIYKENNISLKIKDNNKTKLQLFNSLKKKNLI